MKIRELIGAVMIMTGIFSGGLGFFGMFFQDWHGTHGRGVISGGDLPTMYYVLLGLLLTVAGAVVARAAARQRHHYMS